MARPAVALGSIHGPAGVSQKWSATRAKVPKWFPQGPK